MLIVNKLKRLILPSVIFSLLYFLFFCEYKSLDNLVYSILNGCGHMWFLPMLFWCFLGCWFLEYVRINDGFKFLFLVFLNLCWHVSIPLRISSAISYIVYFYGGFLVYKYCDRFITRIRTLHLVLGWIVFFIVFIILRPMKESLVIDEQNGIWLNQMMLSARSVCQLVYASIGTLVFYITAVWYTRQHIINHFTVKLASCCFGIYLVHQFILKGLYYNTNFPSLVGPYWLPWLGFLLAAPISYLISSILLKTKIGKYLIG